MNRFNITFVYFCINFYSNANLAQIILIYG